MIWPTLCNALMLSSVVSKSFCRPLISIRKVLELCFHLPQLKQLVFKLLQSISPLWVPFAVHIRQ